MFLLILLVFLLVVQGDCEQDFKLQQVLILSRHNVRTPLSKNLAYFTPKKWPTWKEKNGYLTAKGVMLEGYMGEYFKLWLNKEGLLDETCPNEKSFFVYANTAQRTMASAYAFVSKAFPTCNIKIHNASVAVDPIFNPVIHNTSSTFRQEAMEEMRILLSSFHLNNSYRDLEEILQYKQSEYCILERKCDFITDKNKIFVNVGYKPNLEGPLKISKSVIDSFIMENYEGFPIKEVAWGQLLNTKQWDIVLQLSKGYHSTIFNTTLVAKDVAQPLLRYMRDIFINKQYRTTLLMGHDANIYTVLKSMDFKPYDLKNQHEVTPAGGKMVFQRWVDNITGKSYVKIDYVYQTTDEMRQGKSLSLTNPPEFTSLELKGCKYEDGLCPWNEFVDLLNNLVDV